MSTTALSCNACTKPFRVMSNQAGRRVRCPHCGVVNTISAAVFDPPRTNAAHEVNRETPTEGVPPGAPPPRDVPEGAALGAFSVSVRDSNRKLAIRDLYRTRMAFTHSALAKLVDFVGKIVLLIALLVEVYVLITTDWSKVAKLPMDLAVPTCALSLLPASSIAVTGLFLLAAAYCTEYLARIAASTERL